MRKQAMIGWIAAAAAMVVPRPAQAQVLPVTLKDTAKFEYAVKAVCGQSTPQGFPQSPLAPGQYFTSINVHNPRSKTVVFRYKVAVTRALVGTTVGQGPIMPFSLAELGGDGALRIDCNRVRQIVPGPFLTPADVYVIIQTPFDLDVVAVYTAAAPGPNGMVVSSLEVERVLARRTLILPNTNTPVDWQVGVASGTVP
jgi:hypothetical protein